MSALLRKVKLAASKLGVAQVESWVDEKKGVPSARRRARQICTLIEGATALTLVHEDKSYVSAAAEAGKAIMHVRRTSAIAR
ncbi:MAG TPA: hypothetical protein VFR39_03160, partial [Burkholderiales bacterium]|nr:hypothetical protein [Burkholderiales bacterium]